MSFNSPTLPCAAAAAIIAAACSQALGFDVGVDVNTDRPRQPVVVQPAAEVGRRWVPERVIRKEERVLVESRREERREERVLIEPARRVSREERVLVEPERVKKISEQVLVRPATATREWVPPVQEEVDVGPVRVKKTVREGFFRNVEVPPVYETRVKEIVLPARYDTVVREVDVPARYETRVVEVPREPRYETVYKDVVIPGHWEDVVVQPPPVVVQPPPRRGLEIDLDIGKKKHDRD